MMGLGALLGAASSVIDMYISYYLNVPSEPCIVLVSCGFFVLAVLFSPSQGLLTQPETVNRSVNILRQLKHTEQNKRLP